MSSRRAEKAASDHDADDEALAAVDGAAVPTLGRTDPTAPTTRTRWCPGRSRDYSSWPMWRREASRVRPPPRGSRLDYR